MAEVVSADGSTQRRMQAEMPQETVPVPRGEPQAQDVEQPRNEQPTDVKRTLRQLRSLQVAGELPTDQKQNGQPQDRLEDRPGSPKFAAHATIVPAGFGPVRRRAVAG